MQTSTPPPHPYLWWATSSQQPLAVTASGSWGRWGGGGGVELGIRGAFQSMVAAAGVNMQSLP